MEQVLRSAQILKQESEEIGYEGKEMEKHPDGGVTSRR